MAGTICFITALFIGSSPKADALCSTVVTVTPLLVLSFAAIVKKQHNFYVALFFAFIGLAPNIGLGFGGLSYEQNAECIGTAMVGNRASGGRYMNLVEFAEFVLHHVAYYLYRFGRTGGMRDKNAFVCYIVTVPQAVGNIAFQGLFK